MVYKISKLMFENQLNIIENSEFVDPNSKQFFYRAVIDGDIDTSKLKKQLYDILPNANISVLMSQKKNIVLFCTKESHVLGDILISHFSGVLGANIVGVISNHNHLQSLVNKFDIPYHYISASGCSRDEHESKILDILSTYSYDYVVLAKYMRVLSPAFVSSFESSKIINIHHSFLPAFIGANPYKQAYDRGVKVIGATAHFVNDDLDEGPIIVQDVVGVNHTHSWQQMKQIGQLIETKVMSQSLSLVLDNRVFVSGNKTIIL